MRSATQEIASIVSEIEFKDLSREVVQESKYILLDSIGCALAGLAIDKGKISVKMARSLGGSCQASVIGTADKVSCTNAAFANGELINALDYDCVTVGHVAPYVLPAPLALGELRGASGKDLILAIAISYEVTKRLYEALKLSTLASPAIIHETARQMAEALKRPAPKLPVFGYGLTSFGGTAATGRIMKLGAQKMSHALGIAGQFCPVPIRTKWANTMPPPMNKYLCAGWMGEVEITAALLAEMGYTGDTTLFDGEYGFWKFWGGAEGWEPERLTERFGQEWHFLAESSYKFWPCCGHFQIALDLFSRIINENNLMPEDIDKVVLQLSPGICGPHGQNRRITSEIEAQFSGPYVISVAAHRVRLGSDWQQLDTIRNPLIVEFMKKVELHPDEVFARALFEDPQNAALLTKVEVQAKGKWFKEEKKAAVVRSGITAGAPSNPRDAELKYKRLEEKFRSNACRVLTWDKIDQAVNSILELEKIETVSQLLEQVTL